MIPSHKHNTIKRKHYRIQQLLVRSINLTHKSPQEPEAIIPPILRSRLSISHSPPLSWKGSVLSAAEEWDEPDHEPCVQNTAHVLLALDNGTKYIDSRINHKQDRTCLPNTVKVSIINCIFIWIVQNLPHFLKWMLPVLCSNHQCPDHKIMSLASLEANSSMTPSTDSGFVYLKTMCTPWAMEVG